METWYIKIRYDGKSGDAIFYYRKGRKGKWKKMTSEDLEDLRDWISKYV